MLNYLQRSSLYLNEWCSLEGKGTPGHAEEWQDVYAKKRDFQQSRMKEINSFLNGEYLRTLTKVYLSLFCHLQQIFLLCCLQIFLGSCFLLSGTTLWVLSQTCFLWLTEDTSYVTGATTTCSYAFAKYLLNSIKGILGPPCKRGIQHRR